VIEIHGDAIPLIFDAIALIFDAVTAAKTEREQPALPCQAMNQEPLQNHFDTVGRHPPFADSCDAQFPAQR
jgi:hypothetical protein